MIKLATIILLLSASISSWAGLPPTSTKFSGDSTPATTFEIDFPNATVTHSGTKATFGVQGVAGGGTGLATVASGNLMLGNGTSAFNLLAPSSNGFVVTDTGSTFQSQAGPSASSSSDNLLGLGLSSSVGSSALTIALKQSDGSSDPSVGNPVYIGMRSSTATSAGYNQRSITAALSLTISSGTTLGLLASVPTYLFVYAIDSDGAGTMKLGISTLALDEGSLQSSVAESFSTSCTQASPSVCTSTGHGLNNGDAVQLTGTISGGLTTATTYFVVAKAANTFELSATQGGSAINKTTGGTQTPTVNIAGPRLVSGAVYSSVPVRLIGRGLYSEATPGTWASNDTEISVTPNSTWLNNFPSALIGGNAAGTTACSGTCTIARESIPWLAAPPTRTGTGAYTVTFMPVFSSAPNCWCAAGGVNSDRYCSINGAPSTTTLSLTTGSATGGGTREDNNFTIYCTGQR